MALPAQKIQTVEVSNDLSLSDLADRISTYHERCQLALGSAVEHAQAAGRLLIQAKTKVQHGEWMPWVEKNFDFSHSTAVGYMKIAKSQPELRISGGLKGTLKALVEKPVETEQPTRRTRRRPPKRLWSREQVLIEEIYQEVHKNPNLVHFKKLRRDLDELKGLVDNSAAEADDDDDDDDEQTPH